MNQNRNYLSGWTTAEKIAQRCRVGDRLQFYRNSYSHWAIVASIEISQHHHDVTIVRATHLRRTGGSNGFVMGLLTGDSGGTVGVDNIIDIAHGSRV